MTDEQIIGLAKQAGQTRSTPDNCGIYVWSATPASLQRFAQLVRNEVEGYYEDLLFHIEDAMRNEPQPYEVEKAVERIRSMKK